MLQVRTRFASAVTRKRWLILQLWLKRQAKHPKIRRLERYSYHDYEHFIRLDRPENLDPSLIALLEESYAMSSL